jgi:glycerate dehydrogenase
VAVRLANADVAILNKVVIGSEELALATQLSLIAVTATGTNNIDFSATEAAGVTVINSVDYGTQSVVQHSLGLIFALTVNLLPYARGVAEDRWSDSDHFCSLAHPISEITEKTLGIIGYGVLGQELARQAKLLGMRVIVAQSVRQGAVKEVNRVALEALLQQADVVSLHCPLTDDTRGLIGLAELQRMKPDALLINCARGGIVCETALAEVLNEGHLGGIGFDVLAKEPPAKNHPLINTSHPNVVITPHVAWGSRNARQTLVNQIGEDMAAFIAGEPLKREVRG